MNGSRRIAVFLVGLLYAASFPVSVLGGNLVLNLNPDGSYSYNFKLTDQSKSESRNVAGKVQGAFSYTGKDGQEKSITYTADEGGFQPIGAHIPKPEDVPQAPTLADFGVPAASYNAPPAPIPAPFTGGRASSGTMNLSLKPGGIYSYDYTLNDQAKSESRDAQGKVKGKFSFQGKDGQERSLTYTADEGGFQPIGAHLPKPDDVPAMPVSMSLGGSAYTPMSGNAFPSSSSAGASSGSMTLNLQPGGIYSYDYTLNDQAKSESRNAAGKVEGQFSFTDPKGGKKSIKYTADKGGFQPVGDHIPKPSAEIAAALASLGVDVSSAGTGGGISTGSGGGGSYTFNYDTGAQSHSQSGSGYASGGSGSSNGGSSGYKGEPENYPSAPSNYAFSYNAPAHSRSESRAKRQANNFKFDYNTGDHSHSQSGSASAAGSASDSSPESSNNEGESAQTGQGQVQGKYSVNSPAGSSQSVSYTAGGKAGYNPTVQASIALGNGAKKAASPPASADPGLPPQQPQAPNENTGSGNAVQGKYDVNDPSGSQQSVTYTAGGKDGYKPTVSVSAKVGKVKRDVEGKYTVKGKDSSQETTYKATKDGFMPIHSITITLGKP